MGYSWYIYEHKHFKEKQKQKQKKRFWIIDVQLQVWWAGLQIKSTYKFIGAVCLLLYPFTLGGREEKKKKTGFEHFPIILSPCCGAIRCSSLRFSDPTFTTSGASTVLLTTSVLFFVFFVVIFFLFFFFFPDASLANEKVLTIRSERSMSLWKAGASSAATLFCFPCETPTYIRMIHLQSH